MEATASSTRAFLGTGWKFPLQVSPDGSMARAQYEQRIEESVYLILSTGRGERVMLPDFGCGIHELVFAPNSSRTRSVVVQQIRQSLALFERRIDVLDVTAESADDQPNLLLIRVNYRLRSNNAVGNLVYPFYVQEGV